MSGDNSAIYLLIMEVQKSVSDLAINVERINSAINVIKIKVDHIEGQQTDHVSTVQTLALSLAAAKQQLIEYAATISKAERTLREHDAPVAQLVEQQRDWKTIKTYWKELLIAILFVGLLLTIIGQENIIQILKKKLVG